LFRRRYSCLWTRLQTLLTKLCKTTEDIQPWIWGEMVTFMCFLSMYVLEYCCVWGHPTMNLGWDGYLYVFSEYVCIRVLLCLTTSNHQSGVRWLLVCVLREFTLYVCVCACLCVWIFVCVRERERECVCVCVNDFFRFSMCICEYVCMCVCIHVCVYDLYACMICMYICVQ
jgi:hypothetical protein